MGSLQEGPEAILESAWAHGDMHVLLQGSLLRSVCVSPDCGDAD
jgi:hypothetical protein